MIYSLLVANFIMILGFLLKLSKIPPQIPFFYSRPEGEAQLINWWLIFLLPLLLNLLFLLNTFLFKKFFDENEFIKTFFYYFKLFLIISFTLIFLKIIFLVT